MIVLNKKNELIYLTRDEVKVKFEKFPVAIFPIGATEQHGHHLPLGTDIFLANEISKRVSEKTDAVLLPPMPFGYSWVWRDIPGTVSIQQQHVEAIIKDVAHSLSRYGVKLLVVINGHDANNSSMKYATRELMDEIDMKILYLFYPDMTEIIEEYLESETWYGMIHACEFETSLMLALNSKLVQMDKAVYEYPEKPSLYGESSISLGEISKSGVFGDPTKASKKKGEKLLDIFVDKMSSKLLEAYKMVK